MTPQSHGVIPRNGTPQSVRPSKSALPEPPPELLLSELFPLLVLFVLVLELFVLLELLLEFEFEFELVISLIWSSVTGSLLTLFRIVSAPFVASG